MSTADSNAPDATGKTQKPNKPNPGTFRQFRLVLAGASAGTLYGLAGKATAGAAAALGFDFSPAVFTAITR